MAIHLKGTEVLIIPEQRELGGLSLGVHKALLTFEVAKVYLGRNAFFSTIHKYG